MASPATFNFTDGVSGYVEKIVFGLNTSYAAATGWSSCQVRYYVTSFGNLNDKRAVFQFDTSSIGSGATVTKVELKLVEAVSQPTTPPLDYHLHMGSWIGDTLDASSADWGGGTVVESSWSYTDNTFMTLSDDSHDEINTTGDTDVMLRVDSANSNVDYGRNFNTSRNKCQLKVTYTTPEGKTHVKVFNRLRRGIARR